MTDETEEQGLQERNRQDWYEVRVEGHFNPGWFSWLEGWEITPLRDPPAERPPASLRD